VVLLGAVHVHRGANRSRQTPGDLTGYLLLRHRSTVELIDRAVAALDSGAWNGSGAVMDEGVVMDEARRG
jgi:hypothetical protein